MSGWKPASYPSVSPYLICAEAEALIEFLRVAFGGRLKRRFDHPDGSLMHAEVQVDDSIVMIGGGSSDATTSSAHIHLYVQDAPASFGRAVSAGAIVIRELERKTEDDDLRGGVQDPVSGTIWWIATQN